MDEQQRAAKKKYAGEKQPSMKRRDDNHDYTERRMYMITMEVEGRRPLFGVVTGDPHAPQGSSDSPHIVLSPIGQAVQDEWLGIPRYYPQIEVVAVQMMPDHMHGILFVKERIPVHLSQIIKGFKTGCTGWHRAHLASHITWRETCHACRFRRRPSYCGHHGKRLYAPFKAPWRAV